jgi:hypothetical protein
MVWIELIGLRKGPVEVSFEHGNEPSGFMKWCEVLE